LPRIVRAAIAGYACVAAAILILPRVRRARIAELTPET
jgi:hypothetical protein